MSNAGQAGSAIVGGIIGYVATGFNPMGALYGAQIGMLAGTLLFPTQLPNVYGPRIEDLATTQAQLGGPVPIIYGTIAVPGTVIFLSCVEERATTEELGGKGGPEQSSTTYTYYQTIALGLCEGPITGLLRVWENGELKYDVRAQQDGESIDDYLDRIEMSSEYSATFTLYLGDELQQADPTIELTMGVGEVPAFRGLAYIVYPNRQLRDEQARRHPQFRFEVWRGQTVQQVVPPTTLYGSLNNYQANFILPDWPRNRYYTIDLTGDANGIRVYDILENTELEQKTFDEILDPAETVLSFNGAAIGPDGFLYLNFWASGDTVRIVRVDPTTLESTSSAVTSGLTGYWQRALVIRHYGMAETSDWLFSQSNFDWFAVRRCSPEIGQPTLTIEHTNDEALVVNGYRVGSTSYAYALTWSAAISGTGPGIDVFELRIEDVPGIDPFSPVPTPFLENIATIAPSRLDPDCTRLYRVTGLVFDETDHTLIFGAQGLDAGSTSVVEAFFKYDPATDTIVWRADLFIAVYDDHTHNSRLRGAYYAVPQPSREIALIDTRTGAYTVRDFDDEVPNLFTGEQLFDSAQGTVITFVFGYGPWVIFLDRALPGAVSVASIVSDVCARCGLEAAEIDVTELEEREVNGYAVTRPSPGRGIIEPLREVAFFDQVESDGRLKFPTRGKPIAVTLTEDDLGAHYANEERPPLVTTSKLLDVELPRRLRLQYIAESRDYDTGDAPSPTRVTSLAVNEIDIQVPVSITDDHALQAAEVLWADAWGSRWNHNIALDVAYLALDPTDVVGVPVDGRIHRARITAIDDGAGFLRRMTLVRDDDGRYTSTAVADPPQRPRLNVISYSASGLLLLDLPALRDSDNDPGLYAVAYPVTPARTWSGAVIHRSVDGATYAELGSVTTAGIVGRLVTELPAGLSTTWDFENVIDVEMISGTLESRTEEAVLAGANAAAIGTHGRWEIVQFLTATQVSDTRWQLSGLLRGRRATEHHIGTSSVDDYFVMLSAGGVIRLPLQTSEIGAARLYRAVTFGTSAAEAGGLSFAGNGEALRPFSPVHIYGEQSGGDLIIHWTRRGRIGQELRSGADIPLSEESEAYEIDILSPGNSPLSVLRTLESATTSATYSAADQTTDGFAPGDPIMVRVYQISATVGRGTAGEEILV